MMRKLIVLIAATEFVNNATAQKTSNILCITGWRSRKGNTSL